MPPKRKESDSKTDSELGVGSTHLKARLRSFKYTDTSSAQAPDTQQSTSTKSAPSHPKERRRPQREEDSETAIRNAKRQKTQSAKYAAPSKYAHLPYLNDVITDNLILLFIGLNPGVTTAKEGHAYAHPSNHFWKLLYSSGCTDRRCSPEEDVNMPELYSMGFTNIVSRPSKDQSELTRSEMVAGTPILEEKARRWRPEAVCLVGKGIWEAVYQWKYGKKLPKAEFKYGWQDDQHNLGKDKEWTGAMIFVAASTSGASASLKPPEKEAIWQPLGEWVKRRRVERAKVMKESDLEAEKDVNEKD